MPKTLKSGWELWKDVNGLLESLIQEVDEAKRSETFKKWLDWQSAFHKYSFYNTLLILTQNPEATNVAGYNAWKKLGRHVRLGEHGIRILSPSSKKVIDEDGDEIKKLYFFAVSVFDVSQTDGDPIPELTWYGTERDEEVEVSLLKFASDKGIKVSRDLTGQARGISAGGSIRLREDAGTSTLVHEIAHELLHKGERDKPRSQKEAEAEGTAYIVCKSLGIPVTGHGNYLAGWTTVPELRSSLKSIANAAKEILTALEGAPCPTTA